MNFLCNEGLPIDLGWTLLIAWTANTCVPPKIQFPALNLNLAGLALHVQALSQPYPRWCSVLHWMLMMLHVATHVQSCQLFEPVPEWLEYWYFCNFVNPHHLICHSYFQVFSKWQHIKPQGNAKLLANNAKWRHVVLSRRCCSVQPSKQHSCQLLVPEWLYQRVHTTASVASVSLVSKYTTDIQNMCVKGSCAGAYYFKRGAKRSSLYTYIRTSGSNLLYS